MRGNGAVLKLGERQCRSHGRAHLVASLSRRPVTVPGVREAHACSAYDSRGVSSRSTSKFGSPLSNKVRQNVGIVGGEAIRTLGPLVPTTVQMEPKSRTICLPFDERPRRRMSYGSTRAVSRPQDTAERASRNAPRGSGTVSANPRGHERDYGDTDSK